MLSLRFSVLVLLATTAACSASSTTGNVFTTGTGGGDSTTGTGGEGGAGGAGTTTGDGGGNFTTGIGGGGTGGGEMLVAEVWGQSPDTLYKLDPKTNAVTTIGKFQGCGSGGVIDIALDKDSTLYAATSTGLYTVDRVTAKCTLIAPGMYPNSLSFVPAGTVDANVEALVGYNGAQYIRIDPKSGGVTPIGQLSNGYTSSGDVVSVKGKTYLTANGASCTKGDCLLEINPKTGDVVKNWGTVGYDAVFGLAFWAGKAYGFTDAGEVFEIDFTPTGITQTKITIPGNLTLKFWGAGSTTVAPPNTIPQ